MHGLFLLFAKPRAQYPRAMLPFESHVVGKRNLYWIMLLDSYCKKYLYIKLIRMPPMLSSEILASYLKRSETYLSYAVNYLVC